MEFKHQQPQPFMMLSSQAGYGKVMEEFEQHPWCLEAHHNFMVEVLEGDMFYRELHPAQPIHPIEPSGPIGPMNPSSPLNGGVPEPSSWILLLSALISVSLVMCQARLRPDLRTEQAGRKSKRELDVLLAHLPTLQEGRFHIFTGTALDDRCDKHTLPRSVR